MGHWSRMGQDHNGKPIKWTCPQTCRGFGRRSDPFGCHDDLSGDPLNTRYPDKFKDAPGDLRRCPHREIREGWDHWTDAVYQIHQDREAGVIQGWPEDYSSATVEAVRLLTSEAKASEAAIWDEAR